MEPRYSDCSLPQQHMCLPASTSSPAQGFLGGGVLPAACFLPMAGGLGITAPGLLCSSLAVTTELVQPFAQCLARYPCAAAQDGAETP